MALASCWAAASPRRSSAPGAVGPRPRTPSARRRLRVRDLLAVRFWTAGSPRSWRRTCGGCARRGAGASPTPRTSREPPRPDCRHGPETRTEPSPRPSTGVLPMTARHRPRPAGRGPFPPRAAQACCSLALVALAVGACAGGASEPLPVGPPVEDGAAEMPAPAATAAPAEDSTQGRLGDRPQRRRVRRRRRRPADRPNGPARPRGRGPRRRARRGREGRRGRRRLRRRLAAPGRRRTRRRLGHLPRPGRPLGGHPRRAPRRRHEDPRRADRQRGGHQPGRRPRRPARQPAGDRGRPPGDHGEGHQDHRHPRGPGPARPASARRSSSSPPRSRRSRSRPPWPRSPSASRCRRSSP